MLLKLLLVSNNAYIVAILNIERSTMNNENEAMDTEIPIEVSEEERQMLIECIKSAEQGNVYTQHEVDIHVKNMIKELKEHKQQRLLLKVGS